MAAVPSIAHRMEPGGAAPEPHWQPGAWGSKLGSLEQSQLPAHDNTGLVLVRAQGCLTFQRDGDISGRGSRQWMGSPGRRKAMIKGTAVGKDSKHFMNE